MRRGFKAKAERLSLELRNEIGVLPTDPIDAEAFLLRRGVLVIRPSQIPGLSKESIDQLTRHDRDSWSGLTVREAGLVAVVINDAHPRTRQANTLMHEWAHIELMHKPSRVDQSESGILLLSDYPQEFEDEANWLAGAILLPREGIVRHRARGKTLDEIADHYGVSRELSQWRLSITGVER